MYRNVFAAFLIATVFVITGCGTSAPTIDTKMRDRSFDRSEPEVDSLRGAWYLMIFRTVSFESISYVTFDAYGVEIDIKRNPDASEQEHAMLLADLAVLYYREFGMTPMGVDLEKSRLTFLPPDGMVRKWWKERVIEWFPQSYSMASAAR